MIDLLKKIASDSFKVFFGYNRLQILKIKKRVETIAVYIYILYYIILCDRVTTVTKKTIYVYGLFYISIHFWWLHCLHGHKPPVAIENRIITTGYIPVTSGYIGGYNGKF